jgi:hypothetical protein
MGLAQLQLNALSVAKDIGKAFGLRPRPHLAPPRHLLPRGHPRLQRAVPRRLQDRRAAALLADVRLALPRRQPHFTNTWVVDRRVRETTI